jgi:hypothetical protein
MRTAARFLPAHWFGRLGLAAVLATVIGASALPVAGAGRAAGHSSSAKHKRHKKHPKCPLQTEVTYADLHLHARYMDAQVLDPANGEIRAQLKWRTKTKRVVISSVKYYVVPNGADAVEYGPYPLRTGPHGGHASPVVGPSGRVRVVICGRLIGRARPHQHRRTTLSRHPGLGPSCWNPLKKAPESCKVHGRDCNRHPLYITVGYGGLKGGDIKLMSASRGSYNGTGQPLAWHAIQRGVVFCWAEWRTLSSPGAFLDHEVKHRLYTGRHSGHGLARTRERIALYAFARFQ